MVGTPCRLWRPAGEHARSSVVLRSPQIATRVQRGAGVKLGHAKARVQIHPVAAGSQAAEIGALPDAAIIRDVETVESGKRDGVLIGVDDTAGLHWPDQAEARPTIDGDHDPDAAKNHMGWIDGINADHIRVPPARLNPTRIGEVIDESRAVHRDGLPGRAAIGGAIKLTKLTVEDAMRLVFRAPPW